MNFQNFADIENALNSPNLPVRDLYLAWEQRLPVPDSAKRAAGAETAQQINWLQRDLSLARRFTEHALQREEFLLVCDAANEALRLWDRANEHDRCELVRVRMDYAAALTRLGRTRDARGVLEPCSNEAFEIRLGRKLKAEVLLQLGDTLREESHHAAARAAKLQTASQALQFYERALALAAPDPERLKALGRAAATALLLADEEGEIRREQAHALARQALEIVERLDASNDPQRITLSARAISLAVLGDTDGAAQAFADLSKDPSVRLTHLTNARYYAGFLAEALGKDRDFFKPAFPPLQLLVFSGHTLDRPGGVPRFPPEAIGAVRTALRERLETLHARVGMVSASAGADLLFIEALRERDGTLHLVLPWAKKEFCRASVQPYDADAAEIGLEPPRWEEKFQRALQEATTIRELGAVYEPSSDVGWDYMMEVTAGMALQTARVSRLDVQPVALWDRGPGRPAGGTGAFFDFWKHQLGQEPVVVPLPPPPPPRASATTLPLTRIAALRRLPRCERPTLHQQVKSMLFADIVGYSKLREEVIPEFVGVFLERVSQLAAKSRHAPRSVNTWGDAVYAVFDFARDAGCFALELTQLILEGEKEWLEKKLFWTEPGTENRHPLNIRVGLHTGPVFIHYDPVVRRLGFTGVHVNRAARIEPVAAHGEVFASEEFAALAELSAEITRRVEASLGAAGQSGAAEVTAAGTDNANFVCEYAGSMPLAKGYPGRHRIYRVLPKRVFDLEDLARAAHAAYCQEARARGETAETNPSLQPWEQVSENLRQANLAQVADIPHKLRALGYELAPGFGLAPSEIKFSAEQLEALSIREHDRWMEERQRQGWTYAPVRDNARKHHPLLVPWADLNEVERDKDRETVRNLPHHITRARFRVRKLAGVR